MPIFNSGTRTIFRQTSAPTGWTKETVNFNGFCLRVTIGEASSGGTVDFTTVFSSTPWTSVPFPMTNLGSTSIGLSTLALHGHTSPGPTGRPILETVNPGLAQTPTPTNNRVATLGANGAGGVPSFTGGGHVHAVTMNISGSSGDLRVKYTDVIICTKD